MSQPISPWRLLRTESPGPDWFWLPGWSFAPEVFAPLYNRLPGQHYGFDYSATGVADNHDFNSCAQALVNQAPASPQRPAIWVGWSLGGALACAALSVSAAASASAMQKTGNITLITLATSATFCRLQAEDEFGLDADLLQQFSQNMQQQPEKTRRRFLALCTQGAADARPLSRLLASHQLSDPATLLPGLDWLRSYRLNPATGNRLQVRQEQHWLGSHDALNAGGLNPVYYSPGHSHAFFLEPEGQVALLTRLQALCCQLKPASGAQG
jgi:thioesterase domain-containing protein